MDIWHILEQKEIKIAKLLGFPLDAKEPSNLLF